MIVLSFISGLMFGLEFVWEDNLVVVDLGIFRIMWFYRMSEEE